MIIAGIAVIAIDAIIAGTANIIAITVSAASVPVSYTHLTLPTKA